MRVPRHWRRALPALALLASAATAQTPAENGVSAERCLDGRVLEHAFDSGALWSVCARLDDVHGLELRDVRYRAPGDTRRPVLRSLHLAQLLLHWHDEPRPTPRLGGPSTGTRGLGGAAALALDASSCAGTAYRIGGTDDATRLCARERPGGLLAKYAQRPALHGERWELFAAARQGLLTWRVGVVLTEDGRIEPSVALSGRIERTGDDPRFGTSLDDDSGAPALGRDALATRATVLASWRLHFALDTPTLDRVEEFDFPLEGGPTARRPMQVRALDGEAFRRVAPERFRGWRVLDPTSGAGYYLDPLGSGRAWNARGDDWARFELALTRARDCERHAEANAATPDAPSCGAGLDDFVDAEPLDGADPVLWFSRTALWSPRREDLPFLSSVVLDFDIAPFDWTDASPFEAGE